MLKVENCVKQQADKLAKENKPFFSGWGEVLF